MIKNVKIGILLFGCVLFQAQFLSAAHVSKKQNQKSGVSAPTQSSWVPKIQYDLLLREKNRVTQERDRITQERDGVMQERDFARWKAADEAKSNNRAWAVVKEYEEEVVKKDNALARQKEIIDVQKKAIIKLSEENEALKMKFADLKHAEQLQTVNEGKNGRKRSAPFDRSAKRKSRFS